MLTYSTWSWSPSDIFLIDHHINIFLRDRGLLIFKIDFISKVQWESRELQHRSYQPDAGSVEFHNLFLLWNMLYITVKILTLWFLFENQTLTVNHFWSLLLGLSANLQEKLTDFLPKLLDCSTEIKSFHDPPKLPFYSTLELCERFSCIMATLCRVPTQDRWARGWGSPTPLFSTTGPVMGKNPWTSLNPCLP